MVDRLVTLFESTDTDFSTNGIGGLPDAITCTVLERRNGEFELSMTYPITGKRYGEIQQRRILLAKPNPYSDPQPFRIYHISKPINGVVTVDAAHISYDMSGFPVSPFSAGSITSALTDLKNACVVECPFIFWTDKTNTADIAVTVPSSMRSILGGNDDSILAVYGGEFEFDRFTVKLHNNRGLNRGVSIRYGKNLLDLTQEENCSNVYTAIYPYWTSKEVYVELPEKVVDVPGTFDYTKILLVNLTQTFKEQPTEAQLRLAALDYISDNNLSSPEVSLTVSFLQLSESEEYNQYALLETVCLCDTVNVEFPKLGVSSTAKVIATTFDVLTNHYDAIELGTEKASLSNTIAEQNHTITSQSDQISNAIDTSELNAAILEATNLITGQNGGYVVLNPPNNPQEILILDTPSIATATNVWRWNSGGLGHSSTGYSGPYTLALTRDGRINASMIMTGVLNGALIQAGTVEAEMLSANYKNSVTTEIGGAITDAFDAALDEDGSITSSITTHIVDAFNDSLDENGQVTDKIETISDQAIADALKAEGVSGATENGEITSAINTAVSTVKTTIEQEFQAGDGHVLSIIENVAVILGVDPEGLKPDYVPEKEGFVQRVEYAISGLEQTVNDLTIAFGNQTIGGINKIRNSSGLNGVSDDWEHTGLVEALQDADAEANTTSGSCFKLNNATLSQTVSVVSGSSYTLSLRSKRSTASRCYVCIENGEKTKYVFDKQSADNNWDDYKLTFTATGDGAVIKIYTSGAYLYVADFMLVEGTIPSHWTPAPNEIYTANVKIDRRGINITNDQSSTQTLIDNTQFAVKHNGDVVLTVNKDLTQLKKTEVTDELTIGRGKFMPHPDGLNFVLLD